MTFRTRLSTLLSGIKRKSHRRRHGSAAARTSLENLEQRLVLSSVSVSGTSLQFVANAGETNDVTVSESAGIITVVDATSPITAGVGVTQVAPNEVTIPTAGLVLINVNLGDLNDTLDMAGVGVVGSLNRTVLTGGEGNDTILGSDLADIINESLGDDWVDGGPNLDQWSMNSDLNMTLTDTTLTVGPEVDTYANMEVVNLGGLLGDNTIDASAVTPASGITNGINMTGREGDDTLISGGVRGVFRDFLGNNSFVGGATTGDAVVAVADVDMTLTDTTLTVGTSVNTISGVERFDLSGGVGDNIMDVSAITAAGHVTSVRLVGNVGDDTLIGSYLADAIVVSGGVNTIDGLGGLDTLAVVADDDLVLTNTTFSIGADVSTHDSIEHVNFIGGAGDNTLDSTATNASGDVEIVFLNGQGGSDTLLGGDLMEIISDSVGNNTVDGGGGSDRWTVTLNSDITASDGTLIAGVDTNSFSNIEDLRLSGGGGDNVIDVSAMTVLSGVDFTLLAGFGGDDTFRPSSDFDIRQSIDGGAGFDELDFSNFPIAPNVVIGGPGGIDGQIGTFVFGNASNGFQNIDLITPTAEYDFTASSYNTLEGNTANTTTVIEVTRSVSTGTATSVDVVLTSGSATAGDDFIGGPITVNFLPGQITKSVPIRLLGDADVESDETLLLSFANGISGAANPTAEFTILNDDFSNLPPEVLAVETDATFADKASPGDSVTLNATFSDPNASDVHSATIDWGDGTSSTGVVSGGNVTGSHTYLIGGIFEVTVTVDDGVETDAAAATAIVSGVRVTDDGTLQIIGTDQRDRIQVKQQGSAIRVKLKDGNGPTQHFFFPTTDVASILIYTCEGNDNVQVHHNINLPTVIDAGSGNDEVIGGSGDDLIRGGSGQDFVFGGQGHDVILGGSGHDVLFGDSGRDIIIAGTGFDLAFGGSGQDILIGSSTVHDDDDTALNSIRDEWTSHKSLAVRKQNLINSTGDGNGLNGTAFLDSLSLIDDNTFDLLFGGWGTDWYPGH